MACAPTPSARTLCASRVQRSRTYEQLATFLATAQRRLPCGEATMFLVFADVGPRPGEALAVREGLRRERPAGGGRKGRAARRQRSLRGNLSLERRYAA